jgi:cold shock CspA family protein
VVAHVDAESGDGFIEALDGREFHFQNSDIRNADVGDLKPGDDVHFELRDASGSPRPGVANVRV